MPIYSYKCRDCEQQFKSFHGIDEKQSCTKCNSGNLERQFIGTSIKISASPEDPRQRVEKFIEESRQALKEQTAEARKDYKQ